MARIDAYLKEIIEHKASDLHICARTYPIMRVFGELLPLRNIILSHNEIKELIEEILTLEEKKKLENGKNLDLIYENYNGKIKQRFRAHILLEQNGLNIFFRVIPNIIPTLKELNLPEILVNFTKLQKGIILITGPSGCGKTTTLASLINEINKNQSRHILTIEDPIEYIHINKRSLVTQRQVGIHVESFEIALLSAMREDPDVIVVGELRDLETIQLAIRAAETGHLVFSTLHTGSAMQTIDRIIEVFPPEQQNQIRMMFSESMRGIISQILIPEKDKRGRIPALEIILYSNQVANLIRENKTFHLVSAVQTNRNMGMQMLDDSLLELLKKGKIYPADAYDLSEDKEIFTPFLEE
ncbi:MAG: PilT/PilU family type 4a pilus ATPase [Armatimonadetes bacterium]|nr:PilT/PilU family type 4a pilus ATPase [Armatimonadota bacterium]